MIHKVLGHGASGNPFDYLLGKKREIPAQVIRGDPQFCWATISAASYQQKYTSAVLSFAETISPELEREIIDDYERVTFAGSAEEFSRVWVRHAEHGRTELHLVVANVHLPTGKRWSHYFDRVDRKLLKAWQELTNLRHGLASPDDLSRMRLADYPGNLPHEKRSLFARLDTQICAGIASGEIQTRADVVKKLAAEGYDVRGSKNFVAVKPSGSCEKALRLRGKKYGEQFSRAALLKSVAKTPPAARERMQIYEKAFADAMAARTVFVNRVRQPRIQKRVPVPPDGLGVLDENIRDASLSVAFTSKCHREEVNNGLAYSQPASNDYRHRTDLSPGLRRINHARGGAVLAAHATTWAAAFHLSAGRFVGAIKQSIAASRHKLSGAVLGVPDLLYQPFFMGQRLNDYLRGQLKRPTPNRLTTQLGDERKPQSILGSVGREPRDREIAFDFPA